MFHQNGDDHVDQHLKKRVDFVLIIRTTHKLGHQNKDNEEEGSKILVDTAVPAKDDISQS